ncbi:hypothetical protein GGQ84_002475 [Desulfitispora alkaliphila]|uniref:hypothetical protein n=1 Tax=Desulfitispora alkaliphila TaxID=622674 RepID=UPI003D1B21C7
MKDLILRKGYIIDGNTVKCLIILKNGVEATGTANLSLPDAEEVAYSQAMLKLKSYIKCPSCMEN